ncbi:MAG TPA: tetratricopeptide repeat protein [bacterium]
MTTRENRPLAAGVAVALFLLAAAVFWPARRNGYYQIDDGLYVLVNDRVREGLRWRGVAWAFTSVGYASNWHPLTWLSHMADVDLHGLDPAGHHQTSVLLHAAVSALLFLALRALTGATWPAAAVGALHAVHPLRVESVAWISERKDLLAGLFWMAGLLAWARYVRRPAPWRYVAVAACHALGLLSKPTMVTFPLALLLLDWWPLGRLHGRDGALRRALAEKAPLLALSLAGGLMTLWAQGTAVVPLADMSLAGRAATGLRALAHYVRTAAWPSGLAAYYPLDAGAGIAAPLAVLATAAAATALAWIARRRAPWLAMGWAWFLVTLLPMAGLVQAGWQAAADRYMYIPLAGPFVAAAWSLAAVPAGRARACAALALVPVAASLVPMTRAQIGYWRDSEVLLRRTLEVTRRNWFAHLQLGRLLAGRQRLDEAEIQLREALAIYPDAPEGHRALGLLRLQQGRADEAVASLRRAVDGRPGAAGMWHDLATALAATGRHAEAAAAFRRAVELEPETAAFWWGLQGELALAGREPEARQVIAAALRRFPGLARLHADAGVLAARAGDLEEARREFEGALELDPGDENTRRNLARLLANPRLREKHGEEP